MSFQNATTVWKNGQLVPWEDATVHLSAHGLHYGTGVFEGIRCYDTPEGPAVFRLREHIARMFASAWLHNIPIPFTQGELVQATLETVAANGLSSAYVRPIVFFGSGSLGLLPNACPTEVAIMAWEWALLLGADSAEKGIRATISSWQKFDSNAMPATAKACGQYLNSVLATREARTRGYHEALLLNSAGNLAEGAGENLFLVKNKTLMTNGQADDVLLGITRDTVIQLARENGYQITTRSLTKLDLLAADEAFVTGTAAEIVPLCEVDGYEIGDGHRPVTRVLQQAFRDAVQGRDPNHTDWLSFVPSHQSAQSEVEVRA